MKVFAFVGPKGSGKDTAADFLTEAAGPGLACLSVSLADGLKHAAAALHGLDPAIFYDLDAKDSPIAGGDTPRDLVIRLSEAVSPMLGEDFHVSTRLRRLAAQRPCDLLVVPDLRLVAEYRAMRELYGSDLTVVHVDRKLVAGPHKTEQEHLEILKADAGHAVLDNTASPEDLRAQVRALARKHLTQCQVSSRCTE